MCPQCLKKVKFVAENKKCAKLLFWEWHIASHNICRFCASEKNAISRFSIAKNQKFVFSKKTEKLLFWEWHITAENIFRILRGRKKCNITVLDSEKRKFIFHIFFKKHPQMWIVYTTVRAGTQNDGVPKSVKIRKSIRILMLLWSLLAVQMPTPELHSLCNRTGMYPVREGYHGVRIP